MCSWWKLRRTLWSQINFLHAAHQPAALWSRLSLCPGPLMSHSSSSGAVFSNCAMLLPVLLSCISHVCKTCKTRAHSSKMWCDIWLGWPSHFRVTVSLEVSHVLTLHLFVRPVHSYFCHESASLGQIVRLHSVHHTPEVGVFKPHCTTAKLYKLKSATDPVIFFAQAAVDGSLLVTIQRTSETPCSDISRIILLAGRLWHLQGWRRRSFEGHTGIWGNLKMS